MVLRENLLFQDLDDDTLEVVVDKMMRKSYAEGDVIIRKGSFISFLSRSLYPLFVGQNSALREAGER